MIYFFSRGWGSSGIRVFLIGLLRFFLLFWFCLMSFWMYLGAFAFLIVGVFCFGIRVVSGPIACFVLVFFIWRFVLLRLLWVLIFFFSFVFFDLCGFGSYECVCLLQSVGIRSCEFFNFCFCFVVCVESGSVSDF